MSLLQRIRGTSTASPPASIKGSGVDRPPTHPARTRPTESAEPAAPAVVRTRMGSVWVGLCTAVVVFTVLVVFMLQNMRDMQISFMGMHGTLPTAIALLIALVAGIALATVFGTARITQLRNLARRRQPR